LDIDGETFRAGFNRAPFLIRHHLADHPLFSLQRLIELANRLPEEKIKYNGSAISVTTGLYGGPRTGLTVKETIQQIEECRSWMVINNVELDPEYRQLLDRCLDEIRLFSEPIDPGMFRREGFIFISSPGSVTPFHMDPEHNFLLQIRGSKRIRLFDGHDPTILSAEELEQHYGGAHRNLVFRDELETKGWTFDLKPGFGLHFPVTAPHYVKNGSEVSVSFSITFRTPDIARRGEAHNFNTFLRRAGMQPAPVGMHPWRDHLKSFTVRAGRRVNRLITRTR